MTNMETHSLAIHARGLAKRFGGIILTIGC